MFHKSMTRSEFLFWRFVDDVMSIQYESARSYPLVYGGCDTTHMSPNLQLLLCIHENEFEASIVINLDEDCPVTADKYLEQIAKAGKANYDVVVNRKFTWNEFSFDEFRNWVLDNGNWSFSEKG